KKMGRFGEFPYEVKARIIRYCSTSTIENLIETHGQKDQIDPGRNPRNFIRQQLTKIRESLQEIVIRLMPYYISWIRINIPKLIELLNKDPEPMPRIMEMYIKDMFGKTIMPQYTTKNQYVTKDLQTPIKIEWIRDKLFQ